MKRAMLYFSAPIAIALALGVLAGHKSTRMSEVGSVESEVAASSSRIANRSDAARPQPQTADEWLKARLLNIPLPEVDVPLAAMLLASTTAAPHHCGPHTHQAQSDDRKPARQHGH